MGVLLTSCVMPVGDEAELGEDKGLMDGFRRNNIMSDAFYRAADLVDERAIQELFENLPYDERSRERPTGAMGYRSWLADYRVSGKSAARLFVELGQEHNINPLILVARLQMEASLVRPRSTPSSSRRNAAFGCGCPDGGGCSRAYSGFAKQIDCAYFYHDKNVQRSMDRTYDWWLGKTTRTLDGYSVTPENHATAALYLYTPWAYGSGGSPSRCRGGACMLYRITNLYLQRLQYLNVVASDVRMSDDEVDGSSVSMSNTQSGKLRGGAYYSWGVLNAFWSGIDNASVRVEGHAISPSFDRNGRWEIDLPDGEYTVQVSAPGFHSSSATCQSGGRFCWVRLERDESVSTEPPMSTMPGVGTACSSGARSGSCIDESIQTCGGKRQPGLCPGGNAVVCCLTESSLTGVGEACTSSDGSRSGSCIDTGLHQCDGDRVSGRCPGSSEVRCCLR